MLHQILIGVKPKLALLSQRAESIPMPSSLHSNWKPPQHLEFNMLPCKDCPLQSFVSSRNGRNWKGLLWPEQHCNQNCTLPRLACSNHACSNDIQNRQPQRACARFQNTWNNCESSNKVVNIMLAFWVRIFVLKLANVSNFLGQLSELT